MATTATTTNEKTETAKQPKGSYLYAVGRRKKSVARVRLYKKGEGKILINERPAKDYFPVYELIQNVLAPLRTSGVEKEIDISIKVSGGGPRGQSDACIHGIARVLTVYDKDLRPALKSEGFLTRDPRRKERKKPGLKKARRAPQFSKR